MDEYFVRWRGTVEGPLREDDLRRKLLDQSVSKHHQVSTDRQQWTALLNHPAFRDACTVVVPPPLPQNLPAMGTAPTGDPAQAWPTEPADAATAAGLRLRRRPEPGGQADDAGPSADLLNARWYYLVGDRPMGPAPLEDLQTLVNLGRLHARSLVCREGDQQWQELGAANLPLTAGDGQSLAGHPVDYASFGLRLLATVLDGLVLLVVALISSVLSVAVRALLAGGGHLVGRDLLGRVFGPDGGLIGIAVAFAVGWLYFTILESSGSQATLGKRALGLRVTDLDGNRVSFGRANQRHAGRILSATLVGLGFLMVLFTPRRQALHDVVAGTLVVKRA